MAEDRTTNIGDFIDMQDIDNMDFSSTLRLRARSIDQRKLWESKDRSAEFLGDIWSLFVDLKKEERIITVLHSVCVELIENSVKYGRQEHDYIITIELCLTSNELMVYVINKSDLSQVPKLEAFAQLILNSDDYKKLFKQKMKEARVAKKQGKRKSQLGYIRIAMQNVRLAWQIKTRPEAAVVTTMARISLATEEA